MRIVASGFLVIVAFGALAFGASATIAAQQKTATPPNISGAWERYGFNLGQPTADGQRRDGTIPPRSEQPSLKPAFQKEYQDRLAAIREANAKGAPLATGAVQCLGEGMPAMMGATFPIEFLQSPGQVTVIEEAFTQVRRIKLDQPQKKVEDIEPGFYGHSVGHWEGDTLMVDTIGVKEDIRYQNVPHSAQMRIREKIHLATPDILWDEVTIDDPVVLEKPFNVYYAYRRMPSYTLLEYICEDNREFRDANGVQQIHVNK